MPDAGGACNAGVSGAERFFAPDYATARERFRAAARRTGAGLHALREENRWHHHGAGNLDHPARQRLLEVLCPSDPMWRRTVVARGVALARAAATWTGRRALE